MTTIKLKAGHNYLIKNFSWTSTSIENVSVLEETDTCFRIQFENQNSKWIEKKDFNLKYKIIEELGLSIGLENILYGKNTL